MKPVIEYLDYRKYILDFYTERKQRSGFTWREFAKAAEFSNPVYLKQVCDGKFKLSAVAAERVAKAMELDGYERTFFLLLVKYGHATTEEERYEFFEPIVAMVREYSAQNLKDDSFRFFETWKNSVIREVAAAMPAAKASDIAKVLYPEISATEVMDTLQFLKDLKLLQCDEFGNYHETHKIISMVNKEAFPVAGQSLQREMGEFALDALKKLPLNERNMTGLTLGISEKMYKRIVSEITDFRRRIISIVTEDKDDVERVYRLNLQFFPFTKNMKKK